MEKLTAVVSVAIVTATAVGGVILFGSGGPSGVRPNTGRAPDAATDELLELLVAEGLTAGAAVDETATRAGADPDFGGELRVLSGGS